MRAGLLSRALAVAAILLATSQVHALQTFPQFMALVEGRATTVAVGTGGTVLVGKAPALGAGSGWLQGGSGANVYGAATVATGVNVASDVAVGVGGLNVAASAAGIVSKTDIAVAAAGCLTGGLAGCVIGAATVGIPLLTSWMSLSNVRFNSQNQVLETAAPVECSTSCYYWAYQLVGQGTPQTAYTYKSRDSLCVAAGQDMTSRNARYQPPYFYSVPQGTCRAMIDGASTATANVYQGPSRPADSPTWYPSTPQSVKDALYRTDPSPLIVDELAKYGNITWSMPTVALTGPATITSPTTTTTNPDGTKKIVSSTTPMTYSGPKATAGPTTTTTTTQSSTGVVTGTTTETTTPGTEAAKVDEGSPSDTALPALPKLYTRQYPDGLVGVWNTKSAAVKATPLMTLVGNLMPDNLGSSGACPRWVLPMDIATWASFGSADVSPPCYLWDFGKAVIIVSSLLLARRLIFGG